MNLNQIDIIVSDVTRVCASLERILDKKADYVDDSFAQFTIGSHCLMQSQNHLIPLENFQSGIILHVEIEDVDQNYKRLKELGIQVLNGPVVTDWGTESLLVEGPAGLVLDFYRMKQVILLSKNLNVLGVEHKKIGVIRSFYVPKCRSYLRIVSVFHRILQDFLEREGYNRTIKSSEVER